MNKYLAGCCLFALLAASGASKGNQQEKESAPLQRMITADSKVRITPGYAEGFQLTYQEGYILVDIHDPQNEEISCTRWFPVGRSRKVFLLIIR